MGVKLKLLLCAAGVAALGACTEGSMREFYSEAGSEVDEGGFGNPTMNNMMAHMAAACRGRAKGYIVPDPVVVLDPASPADAPRYRHAYARCSGELNGKYAEVIWAEYLRAGVPIQLTEQADAEGEGGGGGG